MRRKSYGVLVAIAENLALLVAHSAPRRDDPSSRSVPSAARASTAARVSAATHERALAPRGLPRTLAGRYRLDRRLAAGGMGTVYEALDIALERNVAAKVVRENLADSDGALSRFVEEAKLAARLREHPNVVTVYDFGAIDGRQPFMIMELLVGRTLRHELGTPGGLSPLRTHATLEGVCSAVSAAHRHGLIHRDLKPENIFLAQIERGTVPKVLDFGIAKPVSVVTTMTYRRDTDPMVLLGTLEYMSPEQRRGEAPSVSVGSLEPRRHRARDAERPASGVGVPARCRSVATGRRAQGRHSRRASRCSTARYLSIPPNGLRTQMRSCSSSQRLSRTDASCPRREGGRHDGVFMWS